MSDTFTVTHQAPAMRNTPGVGFTPVMEVTFVTVPSGIVGKVDIPEAAYSADEVVKVVGAKARLLEQVQAL